MGKLIATTQATVDGVVARTTRNRNWPIQHRHVEPSCPTTAKAAVESASARGRKAEIRPQRTAFFTRAAIRASSLGVNSVSANEVAHMAPSSRFAVSLKPNVAYLELNFCALWK